MIAPSAAVASNVGGPISQAEVISRAEYWLNKGIQYNQAGSYPDSSGKRYRTDCSGYVSMALHLTDSPSSGMMLNDSRFRPVSRAELKPGDVLTFSEHVILFAGYDADRVHFTYYTFGSTPVRKVTGATFNGSTLDGHPTSVYQARRYKNVIQGGGAATYSSDMNANGMTDFVTFTPGDATWHILFNNGTEYHRQWGGLPEDLPVSGDFNANGLSDFTIYRPSTGTFHILYDDGSQYTRQWGGPGHLPVAGDFDANGMSDFVTFTPADGMFHILYNNGTEYHRKWGGPGHVPVAGDFDANGMADFATFTPADGMFHILYNNGTEYHRPWGQNGDIPVSGDFNANGMADFAVYRPSTREWHILYNDGSTYTRGLPWGGWGHLPPA
ncbi:hypothetical protein PV646_06575 [Streptomyces sp. ID05-26A]|nr:hypothetical protein [Streptomyces sp. ID05-26A]